MADNTTLPGTGETIRDVDRGISKTQIILIDVGGSASESIIGDGASMPTDIDKVNGLTPSATNPLYVRISDGTNPITPGTEYTEGDTDASISGIAVLGEAGSDTLKPISLDANNALIVSAPPRTSVLYSGTTALTPKFSAISASTSGNNTVVSAVTGKKIRVLSYRFQGDADVSVKFTDGAGGTDLTGAMATGAKGGGGGAAGTVFGHFETSASNALVMNLSGSVQVSGHLTYVEV